MQRKPLHRERRDECKGAERRQHLPDHNNAIRKRALHLRAQRCVKRRDERDRRVRDRDAIGELFEECRGEAVCELRLEDRGAN